ncbi:MAG TPA: hypothetical protein VHD61_08215 [Lacunisphaera sp.]|nr:hypothetical protein [Lacunisphaera sp.]
MTQPRPTDSSLAAASHRGRRLAWFGAVVLGVVSTWFWFSSPWPSLSLNTFAVAICVLGVVPTLLWLHRDDQSYPLPEILQITMVPFYAVPIFSEHKAIMSYSEDVLTNAVLLVAVFQASAFAGSFASSKGYFRRVARTFWHTEFVGEDSLRFTTYTMVSTSLWLLFTSLTDVVPSEYYGAFRAIFFGIGTLSNFVQARMWGAGQLSNAQKNLFVANIIVQVLLQNLSLLLVTSIITILLTIVGFFSSARRIPWLVCLASLAVFGVLHNGKHQMRKVYWEQNPHRLTLVELPAFYSEWVGYGLAASGADEEASPGTETQANIFQRASLIQIVAYAVDTVPVPTPYLNGATYALIPPQVLPRFLWPDKPSPNDSVKILSVRLGVLSEEQAETTSIAYGLIAESYVNFGFPGTAILGFLLGWALRRAALVTSDCSALSIGGIFRILCLAWCLNTETTLAVWLSSFYQACVAIFVPLFFLQSFFK